MFIVNVVLGFPLLSFHTIQSAFGPTSALLCGFARTIRDLLVNKLASFFTLTPLLFVPSFRTLSCFLLTLSSLSVPLTLPSTLFLSPPHAFFLSSLLFPLRVLCPPFVFLPLTLVSLPLPLPQIIELDIQSINASDKVALATEQLILAEREGQAALEREKTRREIELLRKRTENDLIIAQAKTQAERREIEAAAEAETIRVLAKAKMEESQVEIQRVRELIKCGVGSEYMVQCMMAKAWQDIASSDSVQKLIVPYDAAKFLGAMQIMKHVDNSGVSAVVKGEGSEGKM